MRRLHRPRFAVFVTIMATLVIMTAAANASASNAYATAPRTDELSSATTLAWAFAQNDGTIAHVNNKTTAIADAKYAENADVLMFISATAIIEANSTLVLQTTDYASLTKHEATTSSSRDDHSAFEGRTRDASGILLAEHVIITSSLEVPKSAVVAKKTTKTQDAKTANTSGVIRA